jgi:pyruvate carboxylase
VQTHDILKAAPATAHALAGAASLECWGGATFDGAAISLQDASQHSIRVRSPINLVA